MYFAINNGYSSSKSILTDPRRGVWSIQIITPFRSWQCVLLHLFYIFCAIESTLSHCMSLSISFEFLFPKIWDRCLQVIHLLNRETIYQQPLRIGDFLRAMILIAYRHTFQFGMNNGRQFVLNKTIMAHKHRGGGWGKGVLGRYIFLGKCCRPHRIRTPV